MKYSPIRILTALAVLFALCGGQLAGSRAYAQSSTAGNWTLYPAQKTTLTATVRPPIKANGSSVFNSTSTIPVKFKLSTAPGPLVFESIYINNAPSGDPNQEGVPEPVFDDDFAFLTFEPSNSLTFNQLTMLKATYSFIQGNCGGGSLRWSVTLDVNNDNNSPDIDPEFEGAANDRSVFIYYGGHPNFSDCTSGSNNQSGVNMIGLSDLRYDTSQLDGTFYDSYSHAQSLVGSMRVSSVSLVLDSGWMADQKVNLGQVVVNGNEFTPLSGDATNTCELPAATIIVTKLASTPVEEPISVQPRLSNIFFRTMNDCTYMYNLDVSSLLGAGDYSVGLVINQQQIPGAGKFKLQ